MKEKERAPILIAIGITYIFLDEPWVYVFPDVIQMCLWYASEQIGKSTVLSIRHLEVQGNARVLLAHVPFLKAPFKRSFVHQGSCHPNSVPLNSKLHCPYHHIIMLTRSYYDIRDTLSSPTGSESETTANNCKRRPKVFWSHVKQTWLARYWAKKSIGGIKQSSNEGRSILSHRLAQ
jgi:hypothetical protein